MKTATEERLIREVSEAYARYQSSPKLVEHGALLEWFKARRALARYLSEVA